MKEVETTNRPTKTILLTGLSLSKSLVWNLDQELPSDSTTWLMEVGSTGH